MGTKIVMLTIASLLFATVPFTANANIPLETSNGADATTQELIIVCPPPDVGGQCQAYYNVDL